MVAGTYLSIMKRYLEEGEAIIKGLSLISYENIRVARGSAQLAALHAKYKQEWSEIPVLYIWKNRDHEYFLMVDI